MDRVDGGLKRRSIEQPPPHSMTLRTVNPVRDTTGASLRGDGAHSSSGWITTQSSFKIGISAQPRHVSKDSICQGSNVFDSIEVGPQLERSNDGADDIALNALSSAIDRGGVLGAEKDDHVRDLLRVGEAS